MILHKTQTKLLIVSAMCAAIVAAVIPSAHAVGVTAALTLSKSGNDIAIVSGSQFPVGSQVQIQATIQNGSGSTTVLAADGTFHIGFQVPTTLVGNLHIVARAGSVSASGDIPMHLAATTTTTPILSTTTTTSTTSPSTTTTTVAGPPSAKQVVRAAFYYPWFPEGWNQQGYNPFTQYHPSLGYYSSDNAAIVRQQIAAMQYAHLNAAISSWWGQGTPTDTRVPLELNQATGTGFDWSLYYEKEGTGNPSISEISSDLSYIQSKYANNPSYLHISGKPVLFVYGDGTDNCTTVDRWKQANAGRFYIVLKVFSGYQSCASQPDSWHQYGPASAVDQQGKYSFTVSPGFWKRSEPTARLVRDPARFAQNVQQMVASNAPLQLVTTFNEWGEGTSIESAREWQSASGYGTYLDILHQLLPQ